MPGFENFSFDPADFAPQEPSPSATERPRPQPKADFKEDLTEELAGFGFLDEEERMPAALSARAPRRTNNPSQKRKRRGAGINLWVVLAVMLVAGSLFLAGYKLQDQIAGLLNIIGIGGDAVVVGKDLEIRNQKVEFFLEGGKEVLTIRGVIANRADAPRDVPWVRAMLLDEKNVVVMDRVARAPVDGLDAKGTTVFTLRIESPHPDARNINLMFVPPPPAGGEPARRNRG